MNTRNASKNLYIIFAIFFAMILNACEDRYNPDTRMIVGVEQCVTALRCDQLVDGEHMPVPEACPCDMYCAHGEQLGCTTSGYFCEEGCKEDADCEPGTVCDGVQCVTAGVVPGERDGTCTFDETVQVRVDIPVDVDVDVDVDVTENPPPPACDSDGICEAGEDFGCPNDCFCDNDGVCEAGHGENQSNCSDCVVPVDHDQDNDGYDGVQYGGDDCNDANASINPGATEICGNSVDENCDGLVAVCPDHDQDGDGYEGEPWGDDCNDQNPNVHPGATEVCNGIDDDCDGVIDMVDVCPIDMDNDGFARPPHGEDCDDYNPFIHPGAIEVCNGVDDDCDDLIDEDGVCDQPCVPEGGGVSVVLEYPEPSECCAGLTQISCDYPQDGQCATAVGCAYRCTYCGNGTCGLAENKCNCPEDCDKDGDGYQVGTEDCNDLNPSIHPGATEVCDNNIDEDCDGLTDENCAEDHDQDNDGHDAEPWGDDCNDNNASVHPGAAEICNNVDDDCDGLTDEDDVCGVQPCGNGVCDGNETVHTCPEDCICDHDNVIEPVQGEECDDQNMGGHTCSDVGETHGQVYCLWENCKLDYSSCWTPVSQGCDHDGIVEPSQGEKCDDWNMDGKDCTDFGFTGGTLYCLWANCEFDFSACTGQTGDDLWVARKDGECIEINPYYMSMVDPNQTDTFFTGYCPEAGLGDWSVDVQIYDSDGDGWPEYCPPGNSASNPICRGNAKYYDPSASNNWSWSQFEQCCYKPNWLEECGPYLHCAWELQQDGNTKYVGNIMFDPATLEGTGFIEPY